MTRVRIWHPTIRRSLNIRWFLMELHQYLARSIASHRHYTGRHLLGISKPFGRGGRDRTFACESQSLMPYRLATPLNKFNTRYLQLPLRLISTTWDLTCLIELRFFNCTSNGPFHLITCTQLSDMTSDLCLAKISQTCRRRFNT